MFNNNAKGKSMYSLYQILIENQLQTGYTYSQVFGIKW